MQCLEVSGAVRPIYGSLGFKRLTAKMKVLITCRNVGNYWPITQRLLIINFPFKVCNCVRSSKLPYMFREL